MLQLNANVINIFCSVDCNLVVEICAERQVGIESLNFTSLVIVIHILSLEELNSTLDQNTVSFMLTDRSNPQTFCLVIPSLNFKSQIFLFL